jgi:murein DD-endopeptidase MepM/ murein hydrolase activator NlpD
MQVKNTYRLPVEKEYIVEVNRKSSPIHRRDKRFKHAVDFLFTKTVGDYSIVDIPVHAAADGEVVYVKDDSDEGGADEKYLKEGNGVMIKHANDELSYYEHFKQNGIVVRQGDTVKNGDLLGFSGNTGFTFLSHLQFDVRKWFARGKEYFITLEVRFPELGE